jgi:hypothetical protein
MESFGLNSARSFLGKNVNLHLKDGSVIINIQLGDIQKDELNKQKFVTYGASGEKNKLRIPLRSIAWAELLNPLLVKMG